MVPCVFESNGGIGAEGSKLLKLLSVNCRNYTAKEFLLHAHKRISVTMQSANANIAQLAMQRFHLHHHAKNKSIYEAHLLKRAANPRPYSTPIDADELDKIIQPELQASHADFQERKHAAAEAKSDSRAAPFTHVDRMGLIEFGQHAA